MNPISCSLKFSLAWKHDLVQQNTPKNNLHIIFCAMGNWLQTSLLEIKCARKSLPNPCRTVRCRLLWAWRTIFSSALLHSRRVQWAAEKSWVGTWWALFGVVRRKLRFIPDSWHCFLLELIFHRLCHFLIPISPLSRRVWKEYKLLHPFHAGGS